MSHVGRVDPADVEISARRGYVSRWTLGKLTFGYCAGKENDPSCRSCYVRPLILE